MSSESWPPPLKEWVAKCLGQMTDTNREEAQAELRQVIADAFVNKTLWTTDWGGVQLQSLMPKPPPTLNSLNSLSSLKRKLNETHLSTTTTKKVKKTFNNKPPSSSSFDTNDVAALNRRAARFQREHDLERQKGLHGQTGHAHSPYSHVFGNRSATPSFDGDAPEMNVNVPNWDKHTIVGTSKEIFKDYLRLTSASEPKPEQIRPYPILQETLAQLKKRWREKANYNWICSQFKSLRQDLTVQRVKNEFTVTVYEIHARMALEVGDMVEYNQCQAMLRNLYELGIPGKVEEFTAYRILMLLHGRNRSDLNLYVGQLTDKQKVDPAVRHALDVQRALAMGNYHRLFDLYLNAPNMGAYIMDHFIDRERTRALIVMTKAYRTLPLSFIQNELAFDGLAQACDFLTEHKAGLFTNPNAPDAEKILDCKPAGAPLVQVLEEKYRKVQIKGAV
ncbi:SAC3/GANP/Nin1/mts3/eIF-3 p25 family-domain-containing protein [Rhodofomes roseus]|uniref:SAC3/GANP/Nin1/mts3/eIF-3 p25 family-domain-containing protein n=1 Tax=Rhodofomes roseus TaxID=34475 RepID=A0ABQ8KP99_9APHY|nr:SAC3/GANP/Nin1/mts3/eIF-3 p25 family-domain-containing protein [Rhodofomes roseus]KAH9840209.1 SAC3/GANP/Nin1/mts3/eIF-3 p25 family-domain-containing protein [Rhodofomes roseus]